MKRNTLYTLIGLLVVVIVIVATFLYANGQRQAQLRHDQAVQKQSQSQSAKKSTSGSTSSQPKGTATTAPVTGGTAATTPRTGATEDGLIPVTLLGLGAYWYRRSRRSLLGALR